MQLYRHRNFKQVISIELLRKKEELTDDRMAKKVFVENVPGKCPRGRPRKRWGDDLKVN